MYEPTGTGTLDLNWLLGELYKISDAINSNHVEVLRAEPNYLTEGIIVLADGVTWDPLSVGGTDAYFVRYNGTAWKAV